MNESEIRGLIDQVRDNSLTRKQFIRHMIGAGLTVPMAAQMLLTSGLAQAQTASNYKPTKRGGGGALKVLWWQGATLLQPHFASGTKDQEGSRIFYEPLGAWDADGNLVPILAAEVPTLANGGVSKDAKQSLGNSKEMFSGTTASPSQPTTLCLPLLMPPILPLLLTPAIPTKT
jgi:peptide/nickel transport system substrate-binding protein